MSAGGPSAARAEWALAGVQFAATLSWIVYVIHLPALFASNGIGAHWLPWVLMADQAVFAVMDIAFGAAADRLRDAYRRFALPVLALTTVSAAAFLALASLRGAPPAVLLGVLAVWAVSASAARVPTFVLLSRVTTVQRLGRLAVWFSAATALASALAPFVGLALTRLDPRVAFAASALALVAAVAAAMRVGRDAGPDDGAGARRPHWRAVLSLLLVLAVSSLAFQLHAFVNSGPLYLGHADRERLPWLLPLVWVGFFVAIVPVDALLRRVGSLRVAVAGILAAAAASAGAAAAGSLPALASWQLLVGAAWAAAFSAMLKQACDWARPGAEGVVLGGFFAVIAACSLARIGWASQVLPATPGLAAVQPMLPVVLLAVAAAIGALAAARFERQPPITVGGPSR